MRRSSRWSSDRPRSGPTATAGASSPRRRTWTGCVASCSTTHLVSRRRWKSSDPSLLLQAVLALPASPSHSRTTWRCKACRTVVTTTMAGVLPPSPDCSADEPGSLPPPFPFFSSSSLIARAARPSGDKKEPSGSLGGRQASPGVEPEDDTDQRVDWDDATSAKSIAANVYMTFVSPGTEDQQNTDSVEVPHIGQANALMHEWQMDTQQLIEQLATQVPQLAGRPFLSCCLSRTTPCRSHRTSQTRRNGGHLPRPVAPRVPPSSQGSHR
jgi:hypothetical protein